MAYLIIKWLHILSSTFLFGTGVGSAFYMFCANRRRDTRVIAAVTGYVVLADWLFTTPTAIFQPLSGLYLLHLMEVPLRTQWVAWSLVLYVIAIACWLPVVWLQMQMHRMADAAIKSSTPLPERYWRFERAWVLLGIPAFVAFVAIFFLMVARPG